MSTLSDHINEMKAAEAFSRQAGLFDDRYGKDTIIKYKRQRVREHIARYLQPRATLLELNCGSGEDAIFLAARFNQRSQRVQYLIQFTRTIQSPRSWNKHDRTVLCPAEDPDW